MKSKRTPTTTRIPGGIRQYGFLLLPSFFLLHIYNRYFGLVPAGYTWQYAGICTAAALLVYLLFRRFFNSGEKACIFTFVPLLIFFGFGTLKDFLPPGPLTSYKCLFPAIVIILCLLAAYLKKSKRSFRRFSFFLSATTTVIFAVECLLFCWYAATHAERKNDLGDPVSRIAAGFTPCADCVQPDVYFLVFDEFTSLPCLKEYWNYSNDTLDNYFRSHHFFVSGSSHSNYSFTTFSLASTLEMEYLRLPRGYTTAQATDLSKGEYSVFDNNVVDIFEKQGYAIHNYSIFDIKHYPAPAGPYFGYMHHSYIDHETLAGRTMKDLGWLLTPPLMMDTRKKSSLFLKMYFSWHDTDLRQSVERALAGIRQQDPLKKDFFYIHIMLPHGPYIYNADGSLGDYRHPGGMKGYLKQVQYASAVLMNMIDSIRASSSGKAVIIAQGDHGFKSWPGNGNYEARTFANLNAFYFPDTAYAGLYDGISPVNSFRVVFNHFFKAGLPLLKDESVPVFFPPSANKQLVKEQKNSYGN